MTREYALRQLKGLPLDMRDAAKKDIDIKAYKEVKITPSFEIWGNCYQVSIYYKFKLQSGKELFGRAANMSVFCEMAEAARRGEVFSVTYLEGSGVVLEIEAD